MTLAHNIIRLRSRQNLSQEQLANQLDVSRQAVSRWESGDSRPELEKLREMSKIFDIRVDELLSGEVTRKSSPKESASGAGKISRKQLMIILPWILVALLAGAVVILWLSRDNNRPVSTGNSANNTACSIEPNAEKPCLQFYGIQISTADLRDQFIDNKGPGILLIGRSSSEATKNFVSVFNRTIQQIAVTGILFYDLDYADQIDKSAADAVLKTLGLSGDYTSSPEFVYIENGKVIDTFDNTKLSQTALTDFINKSMAAEQDFAKIHTN